MKQIHFDEVLGVFRKILVGQMSREDADLWAQAIIRASDENNVSFYPKEKAKIIWEALMYLYGIDLPGDEKETYLHTKEDISNELYKLEKNLE